MNPSTLISEFAAIVCRRVDASMAADVRALELRDIQAETDRLFERLVAEQQPSVKRGQ